VSHPKKIIHSLAYRLDIDGLRGVAVLFVVIFHAFPRILRTGFTGVDIFFVLSGFLITNIILDRLEDNGYKLRYKGCPSL
jgi:peptidoglycan/LPS O-acetylase OafA/YrhL